MTQHQKSSEARLMHSRILHLLLRAARFSRDDPRELNRHRWQVLHRSFRRG